MTTTHNPQATRKGQKPSVLRLVISLRGACLIGTQGSPSIELASSHPMHGSLCLLMRLDTSCGDGPADLIPQHALSTN